MDLNLKIIYEGKKSLRKFAYILAKTGLDLDGGRMDDGDCVRSWKGWIRIRGKTTLVKNAFIVCFLSNIVSIFKNKENIPIEIYLTSNSF